MVRHLAIIALSALLLAEPIAAQTPADPPAEPGSAPLSIASEPPAPESAKKICRNITFTGSRLPAKKLCKTRQEWDAMTADTQDGMRDRQRSSRNWKPGGD